MDPGLGVFPLAHRPVAAQLREVGEEVEQGEFTGDGHGSLGLEFVAGAEIAGQGGTFVGGVEVVAHDHAAEVAQPGVGPVSGGRVWRRRRQVERDVPACLLLRGSAVADGFEASQRGAGLDLAAGGDEEFANPRGEGCRDDSLHLHALEHEDRGSGGDFGAHRDRSGDHQRWRL